MEQKPSFLGPEEPYENTAEALEPPETSLSLSSMANIHVNGRLLGGDDDPDILRQALTNNRERIAGYFEEARQHFSGMRHHQGAEILPPPLTVFVLTDRTGKKDSNVLTAQGYDNSTSLYRDKDEIVERFHPHLKAVEDSGFAPEVRIMGGRSGRWAFLFIQPSKLENT